MASGTEDIHLNLFYTYATNHLEDNVTRALVIVLRNLAPAHLRLFIQEVILEQIRSRQPGAFAHFDLLAPPAFEFDLQLSGPSGEDEEKLTDKNGVLVGISHSGRQGVVLSPEGSPGGARCDASVKDLANEISVLFESKLTDGLYQKQLDRHFRNFFDENQVSSRDSVFVETSWDKIARVLERVKQNDAKEVFLVTQFVEYLDRLNLLQFRPFTDGDFIERTGKKFDNFVALIGIDLSRSGALGLVIHGGGQRFDFSVGGSQRRLTENIWVEYLDPKDGGGGMSFAIVCGAGKKWRAKQLRRLVKGDPLTLRTIIATLRAGVDPTFEVYLRTHSFLHANRFQREWIGDVGGTPCRFPEGFEEFCRRFDDHRLNANQWLTREEIAVRFDKEIQTRGSAGAVVLGDDGLFPRWKKDYLQYCYAHIEVHVPAKALVGKDEVEAVSVATRVIAALHQTMCELDAALP